MEPGEEGLSAVGDVLGSGNALFYKLSASIHAHRARQHRRLQQMTNHAKAARLVEHELAEKQRREEERLAEQRELQAQRIAASQQKAEQAELRRKEKLAVAAQREEELRRAAAAKLAQGRARAAAVAAERHEVAVLARVKHSVGATRKVEAVRQRAMLEEEEKAAFMRQKMERHEAAVQKAAEEKRAEEAARHAEEERREAARQEAAARAEAEHAERAAWLAERSRHKETQLEARARELAELRALHQRQRGMRAEYVRHRMELAAQQEEERRQQLTTRLAAKQRRVAAMEQEKAVMLRALEGVRRDIRLQERKLRDDLHRMESSDMAPAAEAALLADLQRQLAELMQQPIPCGSRGSSRLSSRPQSRQLLEQAAKPAGAAAQVTYVTAPAAGGSHPGSPASPRIKAVYEENEVAGSSEFPGLPEAACGADAAVDLAAGRDFSRAQQGPQHAGHGSTQAAVNSQQQPEGFTAAIARAKLQQLVVAEMAREAERKAMMQQVMDEGDRRRFQRFFELERHNAMAIMQQLQRQLDLT